MTSPFIARDDEIKTLESHFSRGSRVGILSGPAGVGKTTLVRLFLSDRFGHDFGHHLFPGGVAYIYGYQRADLREEMAHQMSFPPRERSLLVIDEADLLSEPHMADLRRLIGEHPELSVLISSRDQLRFADVAQFSISLAGLSLDAFSELLRQHGGSVSEEMARALWRLTAGNPVMGIAARELVQDRRLSWEQMIHAFEGFARPGILDPNREAVDLETPTPSPLVIQVRSINEELLQMLRSDPTHLRSLSPRRFEEVIAELLSRQGYSVELTPTSDDGGVDIYVARRESFGEFLYLVECKRYTPPQKVGVEIVRSLYGVVQQQNANGGIIVTTSFFTAGAQEFRQTRRYQMHLKDYVELQCWLALV